MDLPQVQMKLIPLIFLVFALALSRVELTTGLVVKGLVSCSDCPPQYDLSGIRVLLKCDKAKDSAIATTKNSGSFEATLPSNSMSLSPPTTCSAQLLGGRTPSYAFKKNMVSKVVEAHGQPNSCTLSTPLAFYTACPLPRKDGRCSSRATIGSSKTINLPLPPEWGLAPSSYYVPFIPIIGIP